MTRSTPQVSTRTCAAVVKLPARDPAQLVKRRLGLAPPVEDRCDFSLIAASRSRKQIITLTWAPVQEVADHIAVRERVGPLVLRQRRRKSNRSFRRINPIGARQYRVQPGLSAPEI
jgi:hypothetical protein